MSVKLTTRQVGDVTVIDASGRITLGEGASTFRDSIRDLSSTGHKKLLLNLAEVSYIDSSGIGEMVSGFTTVTNSAGRGVGHEGGTRLGESGLHRRPATSRQI